MPDVNRSYCTRCKQSVYNCIIDGVRVPLLTRITSGQPEDTGPRLNLNAPAVKLPSWLRELNASPVARMELCVACVVIVFGTPAVEASEDPLIGADVEGVPHPEDFEAGELDAMDAASRRHVEHARVLEAIHIGRGDPQAKALRPRAPRPSRRDPVALNAEVRRLEQENAELRRRFAAEGPAPAQPPA